MNAIGIENGVAKIEDLKGYLPSDASHGYASKYICDFAKKASELFVKNNIEPDKYRVVLSDGNTGYTSIYITKRGSFHGSENKNTRNILIRLLGSELFKLSRRHVGLSDLCKVNVPDIYLSGTIPGQKPVLKSNPPRDCKPSDPPSGTGNKSPVGANGMGGNIRGTKREAHFGCHQERVLRGLFSQNTDIFMFNDLNRIDDEFWPVRQIESGVNGLSLTGKELFIARNNSDKHYHLYCIVKDGQLFQLMDNGRMNHSITWGDGSGTKKMTFVQGSPCQAFSVEGKPARQKMTFVQGSPCQDFNVEGIPVGQKNSADKYLEVGYRYVAKNNEVYIYRDSGKDGKPSSVRRIYRAADLQTCDMGLVFVRDKSSGLFYRCRFFYDDNQCRYQLKKDGLANCQLRFDDCRGIVLSMVAGHPLTNLETLKGMFSSKLIRPYTTMNNGEFFWHNSLATLEARGKFIHTNIGLYTGIGVGCTARSQIQMFKILQPENDQGLIDKYRRNGGVGAEGLVLEYLG